MVNLSANISPPTTLASSLILLGITGTYISGSLCSFSSETKLMLGKYSLRLKYMTLCEAMSPSVTGSLAPSLVWPLLLSPMSCSPLTLTTYSVTET